MQGSLKNKILGAILSISALALFLASLIIGALAVSDGNNLWLAAANSVVSSTLSAASSGCYYNKYYSSSTAYRADNGIATYGLTYTDYQ